MHGSPAASLLCWQSDRDIVPSRIQFSWSDRALLRAICAKFCVVTRPTLYIKIVVQQTSFKFAIEVLVKQPLNQALHGSKVDPTHCYLEFQTSGLLTAQLWAQFSLNFA
jgi:hypothetical protein